MHQGGVLALSSLVREVAVGVQPQRLLFELMAEVIIPAEPLEACDAASKDGNASSVLQRPMMAGSASTAQGLIPALLSLHNPKHSPVLITSYDSSCYRPRSPATPVLV